jgi:hypothetical protein
VGVLTKQQLDEVWVDNGLKFRIERFRSWLMERGLHGFVSVEKLQRHFYDMLEAFFVNGIKETQDGNR